MRAAIELRLTMMPLPCELEQAGAPHQRAGVVDQEVDLGQLREQRFDSGERGEIGANNFAVGARSAHGSQRLQRAFAVTVVMHQDPGDAAPRQRDGGRRADAARSPRHQSGLTAEFIEHPILLREGSSK
ncbi:MAG: hypothetical protein ABSH05_27150 [Bryobacteraceae bacterium]